MSFFLFLASNEKWRIGNRQLHWLLCKNESYKGLAIGERRADKRNVLETLPDTTFHNKSTWKWRICLQCERHLCNSSSLHNWCVASSCCGGSKQGLTESAKSGSYWLEGGRAVWFGKVIIFFQNFFFSTEPSSLAFSVPTANQNIVASHKAKKLMYHK